MKRSLDTADSFPPGTLRLTQRPKFMGIIALFLPLAISSQIAEPRIVEATVFRNGYSFITREVRVDKVGTTIVPVRLDSPAQGTFWYSASQGLTVQSVSVGYLVKKTTDVPGSSDALLSQNVGNQLVVKLKYDKERPNAPRESVEGKLIAFTDEYIIITVDDLNQVISKDRIASFSIRGENVVRSTEQDRASATVTFQTEGQPGTIRYVSLERGLSWKPSYRVEVLDGGKFQLTSKAILFNEIEQLDKIAVKFVTGTPNLPSLSVPDPLFSRDLNSFLDPRYQPESNPRRRPNGLSPDGIDFITYDPTDNAFILKDQGKGQAVEGLFVYELQKVRALKGATTSTELFQSGGTFTRTYRQELNLRESQAPAGVSLILNMTHQGSNPLASGAAALFVGNDFLGQANLPFTRSGDTFVVEAGKAPEVTVGLAVEETGRDRGALKSGKDQVYDLVAYRSTIVCENMKSEEVELNLNGKVLGDVRSAELQPVITKESGDPLSLVSHVTWKLKLKPKSKTTIILVSRTYEPVGK